MRCATTYSLDDLLALDEIDRVARSHRYAHEANHAAQREREARQRNTKRGSR